MAWSLSNPFDLSDLFGLNQASYDKAAASDAAYNKFAEETKAARAAKAAVAPPQVNQPAQDYANLQKQINSLLNQINQRVYAPNLDITGIDAKARATAESNVNPYYVKTLNDFLASQAAKRQQQQKQFDINSKAIEDALKQDLEATALSRTRTTEDTTQKLDQIATAEDQAQVDTGTEFDQARQNQAKLLAAAGLTTSGIGKRQMTGGTEARNTQEERRAQQVETDRKTTQLFKDRTFEDLVKSDELANLKSERGKEQAKFDLDSFITNQGFETEAKKAQLEGERLIAVSREQSNQGRLLVNSFINSIQNPAQRQAALEAYGGLY